MPNSRNIHELHELIAKQQYDKITDEDWETLLAALSEKHDWEQMWRLVQVAPAIWSVQFLLRLKEVAWKPEQSAERAAFTQLAQLAQECSKEKADILVDEQVYCQSMLKGHPVTCLAISPDGRLLATGSAEHRTIQLWSLPDGKVVKALNSCTNGVMSLAISSDGQMLASGSLDGTVRVWSLPDGAVLKRLIHPRCACIAFGPDGQMLTSGSLDGTVRVWSLPDGALKLELERSSQEDWIITGVMISSDGRVLVSGETFYLYDPRICEDLVGDVTQLYRLPDGTLLNSLGGKPLAISSDEQMLVTSGSGDGTVWDGTVRLWRLPDGAALHTLQIDCRDSCRAISPDGRLLASANWSGTVRLWSLSDGALLQNLKGHTRGISCLKFSPDGRMLTSVSYDDTIRLWALWKVRLKQLISELTCLEHLQLVEGVLKEEKVTETERKWLEFLLVLMRRHLSVWALSTLEMLEQSVQAAVYSPEEFDLLMHVCIDSDIASRARQVLSQLRDIEAQEALCRVVIDHEFPFAREAALAGGYLPHDASQRALFLFLTEQWDRYEAFDFDRTLLRTVYTTASPERRQRIADKLRKAGRTDFLPVLVGADYRSRAADMSPAETEVLVQLLADNQEWTRLWTLVFELPLVRSLRIMNILSDQTWQPERDDERTLFQELRTLARNELVTSEEEMRQVLPLALQVARLSIHGRVNDVAFSPVRPVLAIGTGARKVALWNFQQGEMEQVLKGFDHAIGMVTFLPDGTLLCAERMNTVRESCTIYAWHRDQMVRLGQHKGSVTALQAVGEAQFLSTGRDEKIILWDVVAGRKLREQRLAFWARAVRVSPDGQYVALLHKGVRLMSLPQLDKLVDRTDGKVSRCAAFVPHENVLVVGRFSGEVLVYKYSGNDILSVRQSLSPHRQQVQGVAVLPQSPTIITVGAEGTMHFTTWPECSSPGSIELPDEGFTSLHISPDGAFMATGHSDTSLSLWDLRMPNVPPLFTHPFAHASLDQFMAVNALAANLKLEAPVRRALTYIKHILQHRFRFAIEIEDVPAIKVGEFDIEIET